MEDYIVTEWRTTQLRSGGLHKDNNRGCGGPYDRSLPAASYEINLYVVLATNPLLVREANGSHSSSFDNRAYR